MKSFKNNASKIKNPKGFFKTLHIPDLKCDLERVPGDKNAFLILTLFSS